MTEAAFRPAIELTLSFEGGYENNPDDPGGETNFGISKAAYPALNIANLTREDAIAIYHRDYWVRPGFVTMPDLIGRKMLDLAVNVGTTGAAKLLQRALNHADPANALLIDGDLGKASLAALAAAQPQAVLILLRIEAKNHYLAWLPEHQAFRHALGSFLRRAAT